MKAWLGVAKFGTPPPVPAIEELDTDEFEEWSSDSIEVSEEDSGSDDDLPAAWQADFVFGPQED